MALAPLSQTILLTEDGAVIPVTVQVPIPVGDASSGPIITSPAAINSDGTPQVGETFILVRPTGNGPVVAERLLENGVDVFSEVVDLKFTGRIAGPLRYEADLQGPDGTILTSGSDITVSAATAPLTITGTPPTTGTAGQPYSFPPVTAGGSGTRVYTVEGGPLLPGLTQSQVDGAITGAPTAAGTMTGLSVRATDDAGSAATIPTTVTIAAASGGGGDGWGGDGTWGGGGTWGGEGGTTPTTITLSVGSVMSAAEGTPTTGVTLSVGSITSQPEGTPSSGITLSVGSITAQPEGN